MSESAPGSGAGQLFLECDEQGRILWMDPQARARLGESVNLLEAFGRERATYTLGFLSTCRPGDTLAAPVLLTCVLHSGNRVVLSAELRGWAGESLQTMDAQLFRLQSRVLGKYFRLLRVQQSLDSRLRRARRHPGAVLLEQLERERARLARELHSGAGQSLSAIHVYLDLIDKRMPEPPAEVRGYLERIAALAREAAREVRSVAHRLHPPDWMELGLGQALQNLWNSSGIPERFQASLTIPALPAEPPQSVRVALYRAAQEAIANALRHSNANAFALALEQRNGQLVLRVEDNGSGFDPGVRPASGGIGLRSIREQVASLGGQVRITSGAGGTKLEITIPVEPSNE